MHVLYRGGVHYDALVSDAAELEAALAANAAQQQRLAAKQRANPHQHQHQQRQQQQQQQQRQHQAHDRKRMRGGGRKGRRYSW